MEDTEDVLIVEDQVILVVDLDVVSAKSRNEDSSASHED